MTKLAEQAAEVGVAAVSPHPAPSHLAPHLVALPGGEWSLWRSVCLRGAGFPAEMLLDLAAPASAGAADAWLRAEGCVAELRAELAALGTRHSAVGSKEATPNSQLPTPNSQLPTPNSQLPTPNSQLPTPDAQLPTPNSQLPTPNSQRPTPDAQLPTPNSQLPTPNSPGRTPNQRPISDSGESPSTGALAHAAAIEQEIQDAFAQRAAARAVFEETFARDASRTSALLCETVRDPRLREAVLWQNRDAVHTGFEALLRGGSRPGRRAQKERLVASYLQRYCAKNDTIGFFGPVGWARLVDGGPPVSLAPGPHLVSRRTVHFETWTIDALASTLETQPGLRPWLAPRLLPQVRVDGTQILAPRRAPIAIAALHARLLRACDGRRPARTIARELAADPYSGVTRQEDVYVALEAFAQMGLVIWSLQVPLERDPDRALRAQLEAIGEMGLRTACLAVLDRLDAARQSVARAAGDPDALDRSLAELATTFTSLTAAAPTRAAGEMYAGRTLVYEDCRRNADVELGPGLLQRLGPPLSLLLESARWCTFEIASWYRSSLEVIAGRMGLRAGDAVDLAAVLAEGPDFGGPGEIPAPIAAVQAELRRRWLALLGPRLDVPHACYRSADLLPGVRTAFDVPAAGWSWARHVSPDVLISATGADAIARGEYLIVLGEIHLLNTLVQMTCVDEHPDPAELQRALDADCGAPAAVPVHSRTAFSGRTAMGMRPSQTFWYEQSREMASGPRTRVLRTSDLVVRRTERGLLVCTRDGRVTFDAIEFLGYILAMKCATIFGLLPDAPHTPRISIDEVVVARERWQAAARTMEWASAATPLDRFAGARRWAAERGVPRFAFVKSPIERKPCYVDFDSPIYVDAFAKVVRETAKAPADRQSISVTEMLPTPYGLWLVDAEGRRFTSELRMVAVDPRMPPRMPDHSERAVSGGGR